MADRLRIVAIDVDWESLNSLREAFPQWHIEELACATADSLERDWNPRAAELLVVGLREPVVSSLRLVRALRSQLGRAHVALLATVSPGQEALVRAALDAGASACLVLPIHAKELLSMWNRARNGNQPGRHTLDLNHAQRADPWQDEGGES
jgi:DNA-binding response OmpR family regulator